MLGGQHGNVAAEGLSRLSQNPGLTRLKLLKQQNQ